MWGLALESSAKKLHAITKNMLWITRFVASVWDKILNATHLDAGNPINHLLKNSMKIVFWPRIQLGYSKKDDLIMDNSQGMI